MLTDKMREAFGYDSFGNSELLLAELDKQVIDRGIQRAAGMTMCKCGCTYNRHPAVQGALWLTRTCDGIVKL